MRNMSRINKSGFTYIGVLSTVIALAERC